MQQAGESSGLRIRTGVKRNLAFRLRRHIGDHFEGEFLGDVFEVRLEEHVAA